eukprot:TRINITY_DN4701_c0_g1_i2.p1 TRINITY_DN4701_c0_g1~~TRINITY_DN4701_c0_g1_i2.p1  ORF type:complete len:277 (+),score=60.28 TRINITY_DN4701_c0_g1_i2:234-1064(+)
MSPSKELEGEGDTTQWPTGDGQLDEAPVLEVTRVSASPVRTSKRRIKTKVVTRHSPTKASSDPFPTSDAPVPCKRKVVKKKLEDRSTGTEVIQTTDFGCNANLGGIDVAFQQEVWHRVKCRFDSSMSYSSQNLDEFRSGWSNGLALCALLHDCCSSWIDFHNLTPSKGADNIRKALTVSAQKLSVPKPASGVDVVSDPKSLAVYMSLLLLAIQEWEGGEQFRAIKKLNARLVDEISRYRRQRSADRKKVHPTRAPRGSHFSANTFDSGDETDDSVE